MLPCLLIQEWQGKIELVTAKMDGLWKRQRKEMVISLPIPPRALAVIESFPCVDHAGMHLVISPGFHIKLNRKNALYTTKVCARKKSSVNGTHLQWKALHVHTYLDQCEQAQYCSPDWFKPGVQDVEIDVVARRQWSTHGLAWWRIVTELLHEDRKRNNSICTVYEEILVVKIFCVLNFRCIQFLWLKILFCLILLGQATIL